MQKNFVIKTGKKDSKKKTEKSKLLLKKKTMW